MINATHDPRLRSWVPSANDAATDFPLQNLPHGVFRLRGSTAAFAGGVAIGDQILDLNAAAATGAVVPAVDAAWAAAGESSLNRLMALGAGAWSGLRAELSRLLRADAPEADRLRACLVPQSAVELGLPAVIGDYTDFFTSAHHMNNVRQAFGADTPPPPNFKWLPIAYHGRASSVEVSGGAFERPRGQSRPPGASAPVFGPSQRLDYEMELAFWIGPGNARGVPIGIDEAERHIFGVSLLNDWSARDVQAWEAMPLGPFLAKNFLSTVSPWIVTLEALEPFRCALPREPGDPQTLPNLQPSDPAARLGYDLELEVRLQSARSGTNELLLSRSNFRHCYWAMAQMLTHHAEGGCNLRPGDLLGTGTQSGPTQGEQGCLIELSQAAKVPVELSNGERRGFLEDGDTVVMRCWGDRPGAARIGFGECRGTVLPAGAG